jgi:hypothetical protein
MRVGIKLYIYETLLEFILHIIIIVLVINRPILILFQPFFALAFNLKFLSFICTLLIGIYEDAYQNITIDGSERDLLIFYNNFVKVYDDNCNVCMVLLKKKFCLIYL